MRTHRPVQISCNVLFPTFDVEKWEQPYTQYKSLDNSDDHIKLNAFFSNLINKIIIF